MAIIIWRLFALVSHVMMAIKKIRKGSLFNSGSHRVWFQKGKLSDLKMEMFCFEILADIYTINLYVIFEKSSWKNQVRWNGNQFLNWSLQATLAVKILFKIDQNSSSSNLILPNLFFGKSSTDQQGDKFWSLFNSDTISMLRITIWKCEKNASSYRKPFVNCTFYTYIYRYISFSQNSLTRSGAHLT